MSEKQYELSNYIAAVPYKEMEGYVTLFLNSRKGSSKVILGEKDYESIKNGDFSGIDTEVLYEQGILVESREKEKQEMLGFMDEFNQNEYYKAIVVMNLECNLDCIYCFEDAIKTNQQMTAETADALIDYLEKRLTPDKRFLEIAFYGGEPLKSMDRIKDISKKIKERFKGTDYSFRFVTNGTLLTKRIVEELLPLGFKGAKITLDGPRETHDKYRPFKGGGASFDRIIGNIRDVCEICEISISGNYNQENLKSFPLLLDYLMNEGLTPEKIKGVKFSPIMEVPGLKFHQEFNGCLSFNEPWLFESGISLREEILKRGYHTAKTGFAVCMIDVTDYDVINFNGDIYKCPSFLGAEEFIIGNIWKGITDYTETYQLDIWKDPECLDCSYMGLCLGGCRYMSWLREGRMDVLDCWKELFDNTLEAMTLQDVKYMS